MTIGPGFVYFLYSPALDRMKIGRTKANPAKRISMLRTGSPDKLRIAMILYTDDMILEKSIHSAIWKHHSHGEWFNWTACLDDLAAGLLRWPHRTEVVERTARATDVGLSLAKILPVAWGHDGRTVLDILPGERSATGKTYLEYTRHTLFRETIANMEIGDSEVTADDGERAISYAIAISLGRSVKVKKEMGEDQWTITRTA